jgi:hypothetical protein
LILPYVSSTGSVAHKCELIGRECFKRAISQKPFDAEVSDKFQRFKILVGIWFGFRVDARPVIERRLISNRIVGDLNPPRGPIDERRQGLSGSGGDVAGSPRRRQSYNHKCVQREPTEPQTIAHLSVIRLAARDSIRSVGNRLAASPSYLSNGPGSGANRLCCAIRFAE